MTTKRNPREPVVIRREAQPITVGPVVNNRPSTTVVAPPPVEADMLIMASSGPNTGQLVELWKTDKPLVPAAGYGGHPLAARPKKAALTVFEGRQPFSLEGQFYLWENGQSVQKARGILEALAISPFKGYKTRPEPPRCSITARPNLLPPMPNVGKFWWIEDIKWEDEYRLHDWTLTFNVFALTLLEALNDETLQEEETAAGATSTRRRYYVKSGDTLHSIAARELHNADRWKEIAKLNNIRSDGQLAQKVGEEIRLPA